MLKAGISFAQALKSKGIGKGDNVLSLMDNHHFMMPAWLGIVFAEAVLCPFAMTDNSVIGIADPFVRNFIDIELTNEIISTDEISDIIDQVQPKMFVTSRIDLVTDFKDIFKKLNLNCPIFIYKNKTAGCHDLKPLLEQEVNIQEFEVPKLVDPARDVIMLTLSSATTGKPKLINTTHLHVIASL